MERDWAAAGLEIHVTWPLLASAVVKLNKAKLCFLIAKHSSQIIARQLKDEYPEARIIRRETRKSFAIFVTLGTNPAHLNLADFFDLNAFLQTDKKLSLSFSFSIFFIANR